MVEESVLSCEICDLLVQHSSDLVYNDGVIVGFLNVQSKIKGDFLLIPKTHIPIMAVFPPQIFIHLFRSIPKFSSAIKNSVQATGVTISIANGGVAGQESEHFFLHLFPRKKDDEVSVFNIEKKEMKDESLDMLKNNLPIMMSNHFKRNPASWHEGTGLTPDHLKQIRDENKIIYEDEKTLCVAPFQPACTGHLVVYSKEEEKDIEKLSAESSAHLFFVASFAATAVFEGLRAQGTNILAKSGESKDNPQGRLAVHILPRFPDDGMDFYVGNDNKK